MFFFQLNGTDSCGIPFLLRKKKLIEVGQLSISGSKKGMGTSMIATGCRVPPAVYLS